MKMQKLKLQSKNRNGYFCEECGRRKYLYSLLRSKFCFWCKKKTPNDIKVSVSDTVTVRDSLRIRKMKSGIKKFISEFLGGWFPSINPKLPNGVEKSRTIDREKNEYHEIVKKHGTNEVIHECHEPLSEHKK